MMLVTKMMVKIIELSEYMKRICTEPLNFYDSRESRNVPGRNTVWLAPTSEAKCGVKILFQEIS